MENASKALLMAAGVLIALIIIGALLLMFNNLSNYQETNTQNTRESQIVEFNKQFETYNRKDVRGSDLYSLLNKVVDYNRRKSDVATGNDEGQDLKFEPMTIKVTITDKRTIGEEWTYDKTIRLFSQSNLGIVNNQLILTKQTSTKFEKNIEETLRKIESNYSGKTGASNLAAGIDKLFPGKDASEDKKQTAVEFYNRNIATESEKVNNYDELESKRNDILQLVATYYEYVQFKRAYFECSNIEYSKKTGRVIELEFKYNPNKTE